MRAERVGGAVLVLWGALVGTAAADPLFELPAAGEARWGRPGDPAQLAFLAEARALGVLWTNRLTTWPDRQMGLVKDDPQLVAARAGLRVDTCQPFSFVLRVDIAEPTRAWWDGEPLALADGIVDDAYVVWRALRPANVIAGRMRVPFSRPRQEEEVDDPLLMTPFVVDRRAPDRRWGVAVHGDLGSIAYIGGAYEDLDELEPRARVGDPSAGGLAALTAHVEWSPRAPLHGSEPPGAVVGAIGRAPTPRADPWWDTARPAGGLGVLWRPRSDGSQRLDLSLSAQVAWRAFAADAELLFAVDGGRRAAATHGEVIVTPVDRVALTARAERDWDAREWVLAGGATWYVTHDRRNKVALLGWLRRADDRGAAYDGWVVVMAASL